MFKNRKKNLVIIVGTIILFSNAFTLVRKQSTADDLHYLKAMIPTQSTALFKSKRAEIADPEIRKLVDKITKAPKKEIEKMKAFINRLQSKK